MKENKNYAVPAILRANSVLDLLAEKKHVSFNEICSELGMSKSTAYSVINTLLQLGFVRASNKNGFCLGIKLFSLGTKALAELDIRAEAQPIMQKLVNEVDQTSHLGILDCGEAVYLAKVECKQNLIIRSWVGMRLSLQTSAMGKAILAWRDEKDIREILIQNPTKRYTSRAILDIDRFIEHLETVRTNGVSIDNRETNKDNLCLAAPIFSSSNESIGAISVSIPNPRLSPEVFFLVAQQVHHASNELSKRLGSSFYPSFNMPTYPEN